MAKKKLRKLFSMLSSEPNKTLDCSIGICDPICPYNCYQEPSNYSISPQQPPWSSPQPITSPSPSFHQESQEPSSSFDAITIIAVTGATLFILLTGFFLVAKFVSDSVNRERYQSNRDNYDYDHDTVDEELQDREQVDHPIWFIRTTGLQQSIINSITICNYKRGDGLIERTDCPVCLNEFEEGESLRLLPKCNHAFHISCIDTWLKSHTNCPLCRAGIAVSATQQCSVPIDATPGEGSVSRFENDLDRVVIESERLSSSYRDSDNTEPNSDVRIEMYGFSNEIKREESETHTEEKVHFPCTSRVNICREFTREETEEENRVIGDEASCSGENSGHNVELWRGSGSVGSGEFSGEATGETETTDLDISSNGLKTNGSSSVSACFNKNKSSIFPL